MLTRLPVPRGMEVPGGFDDVQPTRIAQPGVHLRTDGPLATQHKAAPRQAVQCIDSDSSVGASVIATSEDVEVIPTTNSDVWASIYFRCNNPDCSTAAACKTCTAGGLDSTSLDCHPGARSDEDCSSSAAA